MIVFGFVVLLVVGGVLLWPQFEKARLHALAEGTWLCGSTTDTTPPIALTIGDGTFDAPATGTSGTWALEDGAVRLHFATATHEENLAPSNWTILGAPTGSTPPPQGVSAVSATALGKTAHETLTWTYTDGRFSLMD